MSAGDGIRLALGTFTVVPVRPPARVDRAAARTAMVLAPVVGAALGLVAAAAYEASRRLGYGDTLAATAAVAVLAVLTRGIHLDGLADTADGLGVRRGRAAALAAMREPAVGAFGMVTVVLVLLTQVLALSQAGAGGGVAAGALVVAAVTGRTAAMLGCLRGVPAARPDGLGAAVAGRVPPSAAAAAVAATLALGFGWGAVDGRPVAAAVAVAAGLAAAAALLARCLRRFGGMTGDVLGAMVEVATTVALVVLAARPTAPAP